MSAKVDFHTNLNAFGGASNAPLKMIYAGAQTNASAKLTFGGASDAPLKITYAGVLRGTRRQ